MKGPSTKARSVDRGVVFDEIGRLLPSWVIHLEAGNRSARTIRDYTDGVHQFERFLTGAGMPLSVSFISREHVEAFLVDVRRRTSSTTPPPATCRLSVSRPSGTSEHRGTSTPT